MNREDAERIERVLNVTLPTEYVDYMCALEYTDSELGAQEPHDPREGFYLYNAADNVLVTNLLHRYYYCTTTPGWPVDEYLAIGHQACGNDFCLELGDTSPKSIYFWHHDTDEDRMFWKVAPTFSQFMAKRVVFELRPDERSDFNPLATKEIWVTRAEASWKSVLQPIKLEEWSEYVETDKEIEIVKYREGINPFTRKSMTFRMRPGTVVWKSASGEEVQIEYYPGCLKMDGNEDAKVTKMKQIAAALNARAVDQDDLQL